MFDEGGWCYYSHPLFVEKSQRMAEWPLVQPYLNEQNLQPPTTVVAMLGRQWPL